MTRKQILIAGAALLIAATAYAQTRDQGSHGDRGNAGAFGQGNGQGGFGQGGDPNTLQGSPPNFGEDDQDTYQSIWPGKAPNEAATRQRGDRDLHRDRRHWHQNRWKAGAGDRWTVGDWTVDGAWENGESHYSLTASAPPDDLHGPDLFLRCRDGQLAPEVLERLERGSGSEWNAEVVDAARGIFAQVLHDVYGSPAATPASRPHRGPQGTGGAVDAAA